mgnify:CR=1 FL=1
MKYFTLILFTLLTSCANYFTVHVTGKNEGDMVIYGNSVCYSPCNVKIKVPDSTYCDSSYIIKTIDKTDEMIRHLNFIGCNDTSLKIPTQEPIRRLW